MNIHDLFSSDMMCVRLRWLSQDKFQVTSFSVCHAISSIPIECIFPTGVGVGGGDGVGVKWTEPCDDLVFLL